ncbi:RecQ family ATP-dependent DNA helicase [Mariprofundus ferrooxydans]|nr:RecQ family ATP-dependent DNA helicase [Mariprofundus ferrooxydans]
MRFGQEIQKMLRRSGSIRALMQARQTLKRYFGFDDFREGQAEVVAAIIGGQSAAAIFPTGSGKSLCYQLPALHLPHLTLVVSPLLALIQDQLAFLQARNIPAASIDSTQSREESSAVMQQVTQGRIKILMISVERLKNERFRLFIARTPVSLLVIDEAHCISEWGHNFRPDYLKLPHYQQALNIPQVLLLTATATPAVIKDMREKFDITAANVIATGFYRANLRLHVQPQPEPEKDRYLSHWLQSHRGQSAIVYVTLQHSAEAVANTLHQAGISAHAYHAGMAHDLRQSIQQQFMQGDIDCIVATIAFGMGIDKSDIRHVIHYDLPKSIENYSQEIGRAGRDGLDSDCLMLAGRNGVHVLENFVYGDTPELSGIRSVLQEIMQAGSKREATWEVMINTLSRASNIRPLPLKTLLVYLEMRHIIKPLYSYYADYRYKLLISEAALLVHFQGERRTFVQAILDGSQRARTWATVDIDAIAQRYHGDRARVVTALEYFNDKQYIELQSKQMTDVFEVIKANFNADEFAEALFIAFKEKEENEINRISQMIAFFEAGDCLSLKLAHYFGDHQRQDDCGHCSACEGASITLPCDVNLPPLSTLNPQELCQMVQAVAGEPLSHDMLTRFLCGISTPLFTRIKARSLPNFGRLEQYRYQDVKVWLT